MLVLQGEHFTSYCCFSSCPFHTLIFIFFTDLSLLPICHHSGEHWYLRSHPEKLTTHPHVRVNISIAFSSSLPSVSLWNQRPKCSHFFACSYHLCGSIGLFARQCARYSRSSIHRSPSLSSHFDYSSCNCCSSSKNYQSRCIMHQWHNAEHAQLSSKSWHRCVYDDHFMSFSRILNQIMTRVHHITQTQVNQIMTQGGKISKNLTTELERKVLIIWLKNW